MPWWLQLLVALTGGLLLLWIGLLIVLAITSRGHDPITLREAVRLLPDVIRLLRRLAADPRLPRAVRVRFWLLLGYLLMPIDLVPDVIPIIGLADDALVVAIALRSVVRAAGPDALAAHWPGTPAGLAVLRRLVHLPEERPPGRTG